jgi:adenosylmethionine-8-amino-7-oxononanoate aminotransferase
MSDLKSRLLAVADVLHQHCYVGSAEDVSEALARIEALEAEDWKGRAEAAERERDEWRAAYEKSRSLGELLGTSVARAEASHAEAVRERDALESLRTSFENRGALLEHDPFPLWMQIVCSFDNMRRRAETAEARTALAVEALERIKRMTTPGSMAWVAAEALAALSPPVSGGDVQDRPTSVEGEP